MNSTSGLRNRSWETLLTVLLASFLPRIACGADNPVPLITQPLIPTAVAAGNAGFPLTVNGTGFASGAAVEWSIGRVTTPLKTNFVSSSELTATVPAADVQTAGAALVTVSNPAPGGGVSNAVSFSITPPVTSLDLSRADYSGTASLPTMTGADLNADGKLDLVLADFGSSVVEVLLGNGDGTFKAAVSYATGTAPLWVAVGDLNNDGKLDLVTANQDGNDVSVLLGNGDGTFQPHVDYPAGGNPTCVIVADFNGDGKLDLAVVANRDHALSILLGNGNGTFQNYGEYAGQNGANSIAAGDFNRDGKTDAVVGNNSGSISVFLGNGDGTFQNQMIFASGASINILTADFNVDGKLDVAGVDDVGYAHVMLGNGDGTFQRDVAYAVQNNPLALGIADVNADGRLDLVVANSCGAQGPGCVGGPGLGSLSVLVGNGDGTFQNQIVYPATGGPTGLVIGDFNADGRLDLATANFLSYSVFLQTTVSFTPNSLDFGHQAVGTASGSQTSTFTNNGTTILNITNISVTGTNASDFSQTNNCGSSLAAGASCTFTVTFTPSAFGGRSAAVDVSDNAPGSPQPLFLSGFGDAAQVQLIPNSLNFGFQVVNTISPSAQVELLNSGTQTLTISSIVVSGDFSLYNPCPSSLAPNKNCLLTVVFKPKSTGVRTGAITVTDNASGSPQTVSLTGTGTFVSVSPAFLNFGNVPIGQTSAPQTVTVTNTAKVSVGLSGIKIGGGPAAGDFAETNNCGSTLGPGASCSITVTFTPKEPIGVSAALGMFAEGAVREVGLSGTGTR